MSNSIKIGDSVGILDEDIKGIVKSVSGDEVLLVDSDGFERTCQTDELIVYDSALAIDTFINTKLSKKELNKPKKADANLNVVDLHNKNTYLNKNEILKNQLSVFTSHINRAIQSRKSKITFIHGEGEGVLRRRIEQILSKSSITFSDAPYHEFGYGAIEVYLTGIRKVLR